MTFSEAKEYFEKTYNVEVNFEEMKTNMEKNQFLDKYLFEKKSETKDTEEQKIYKNYFSQLMHSHLDYHTRILPGKNDYSHLSMLNIPQFLQDYENMMMARHEADPNKSTGRAKHDNIKPYLALSHAVKSTMKYYKSLSEVWADKIIDGKMSFSEFQTLIDAENANIKNGNVDQSLTNVVFARDAMQKLFKKRSFGWIALNPLQAIKQAVYSYKLNKTVKNYENIYAQKISDIKSKNPKSIMSSAHLRANNYVEEQRKLKSLKNNIIAENDKTLNNDNVIEDIKQNVVLENINDNSAKDIKTFEKVVFKTEDFAELTNNNLEKNTVLKETVKEEVSKHFNSSRI